MPDYHLRQMWAVAFAVAAFFALLVWNHSFRKIVGFILMAVIVWCLVGSAMYWAFQIPTPPPTVVTQPAPQNDD